MQRVVVSMELVCLLYMESYFFSLQSRYTTFISDRMKGISHVLKEVWSIEHHHCYRIRHIKANFKQADFGSNELQNLLHVCVTALEIVRYNEPRKQMKTINPDSNAWIKKSLKYQKSNWTFCHDGGVRFNMMAINVSESFNDMLKETRNLPIRLLVAWSFLVWTIISTNVVFKERNDVLTDIEVGSVGKK